VCSQRSRFASRSASANSRTRSGKTSPEKKAISTASEIFCDNLGRFGRGEPLRNEVP